MTEERVLRLEAQVDKVASDLSVVKTDVAKIITRLDIVLDNHEKTLNKHDSDIENLKKDSVDSEKFRKLECDVETLRETSRDVRLFKSTTSKIIGFIAAILIIVLANLFVDYASPRIFPNAQAQVSNLENNIYNSKK